MAERGTPELWRFGLTGGIACGKSTVAARFRVLGLPVVDADALAREVVRPGTPGLAAVVSHFGREVLGRDGHLNRAALGAVVFADPHERRRLNLILHPLIQAAASQQTERLAREGHRLVGYEAALLVENGLAEEFRPLVVVSATPALQLERLMTRNGLGREEAHARIAAQLPLAAQIAVADFVIDASGSLDDTRRQADEVAEAIRRTVPGRR